MTSLWVDNQPGDAVVGGISSVLSGLSQNLMREGDKYTRMYKGKRSRRTSRTKGF